MPSINISESDFETVAWAARDAMDKGDMKQARALDKVARKINAALSNNNPMVIDTGDEAVIECGTATITWHRGFPPKSGMYLVELHDGEHVVTPYQAEPRYVEADQDWDNKTGWICLTHSRATVVAWAEIPKRNVST